MKENRCRLTSAKKLLIHLMSAPAGRVIFFRAKKTIDVDPVYNRHYDRYTGFEDDKKESPR